MVLFYKGTALNDPLVYLRFSFLISAYQRADSQIIFFMFSYIYTVSKGIIRLNWNLTYNKCIFQQIQCEKSVVRLIFAT